jgi:hypothetical protein
MTMAVRTAGSRLQALNEAAHVCNVELSVHPTAPDVAVQANVGFQGNRGSGRRALEMSKMTPLRHQAVREGLCLPREIC